MTGDHTFVFADLAGFTALTEVHGDEAAADVAEAFCALACAELERYGAERVKGIGDALMLHCTSASSAVALAGELAWTIGGTHEFPQVGVGVNTGSAVRRGDDWFGAGVNLAARVTGAAGPGQVLCTASTRAAARPASGLLFTAIGTRRFKNVQEAVALWDLTPTGADSRVPYGIDPVCRMAIDPGRAATSVTVDGLSVPFCSLRCADIYVLTSAPPNDPCQGASP